MTYKDAGGKVGNELLYRDREADVEIVEEGRPWSFDGDGALFRLVSEAQRIHLAHLFDPVLAVHTSVVEPLPHQITAVYESMLPRQPLRFLLSYRVRIGGGEWKDVAQTVHIVRVACRFGGVRPYFICPGVVKGAACRRRVAKLHGPRRYFLCRHCYRLAHASQGEGTMDRMLRRANKIKQRLGGDPGMAAPFPPKPKGMWQRTYERLRDRTFEDELRADQAFTLQAEHLLARIDNPKRKRRFW